MRLLALNWDSDRCSVLAAEVAKSTVQIERALVWNEREPTTPAQAEELGKKLRDFLKSSGVATAPLAICIGRERLLLKEVRYPTVSREEEPAIVRFQAAKEILDNPEEVVLDYAPLPTAGSEARALVAVLRRDVWQTFAALSRVAATRLHVLTARPFAMPGCLTRGRETNEVKLTTHPLAAVLAVSGTRAELTIVRGENVLFSRALEAGPGLAQEIRRSLVVFASQTSESPIESIFILGDDLSSQVLESLRTTLVVPVNPLTVFRNNEAPNGGGFAACFGMLQAIAAERLAIDFAHPKQPRSPQPVNRQRWVLAGGVAFLLLLGLIFLGMTRLAGQREEMERLKEGKEGLEAKLKQYGQERVDLEALKEWERTSVAWVDELQDFTERFPRAVGFHLTKIQAEPLARRSPDDRYVARMNLTGVAPPGKDALVNQFLDSLRDDRRLARIERFKGGTSQEFSFKVDVAAPPAKLPANSRLARGGAP